MKTSRRVLLLVARTLAATAAVAPFAGATGVPAGHWSPAFGLPGVTGQVLCVVTRPDGVIFVGGAFTAAGGVAAANVACWDGSQWKSLAGGVDGRVHTMVVDAQGRLVIGGNFHHAGGAVADNVAAWDGTGWRTLGAGTYHPIGSLVLDADGDLLAGLYYGRQDAPVMRWDGETWSAALPGLTHDASLLVMGKNGETYASGYNHVPDGMPRRNFVSAWDGTAWTTLFESIDTAVSALVIDVNGDLCAGGNFTSIGGVPARSIARWDGTTWSAIGEGLPDWVECLVVDGQGRLCAANGSWIFAETDRQFDYVRWDGATWSSCAPALAGFAGVVAFDPDGRLVAAGSFAEAGTVLAGGLARWDGAGWSTFGAGQGLNGAVMSVAADERGDIYAGGDFTVAGGVPASRIARWNGKSWAALGAGFDLAPTSLACAPGGIVYAAGAFTTADGAPARDVARWNGKAWAGIGPIGRSYSSVTALAVASDGSLYAAGRFLDESQLYFHVARWDGNAWSRVDTASRNDDEVNALVADGAGNIFAVGSFGTLSEPTHGVRKWDGSTWTALGEWPPCSIVNLWCAAWDAAGGLYVGGTIFRDCAPQFSAYLTRWNGSEWREVDGWPDALGWVGAVAVDRQGRLAVACSLATENWIYKHHLMLGDGGAWEDLAPALDGEVMELAFDGRGALATGGWFRMVDAQAASRFALWLPAVATPVASHPAIGHALLHAAPNPFNPRTTVRFELPADAHVRLAIHDVRGRLVRTLVDAEFPRGAHGIDWNGRDEQGADVASGSYFALIEAGERREVMPLTLVK